MRFTRVRFILLAGFFGFVAVYMVLGVLGTSPVMAEQGGELNVTLLLEEPREVQIWDLDGREIGAGEHLGTLGCNGNTCGLETELTFMYPITCYTSNCSEYEFNFVTRNEADPVNSSVVVVGTGTMVRSGQREAFTFIATFQDNRDGTVSAKYEASRPEASFMIPSTPGTLEMYDPR